jgi:hypothetical protein
MARVAVDIVLLPDGAMMDYAIAANAEIAAKFGSEIVLNKKDCLPHISLAMGCVKRGDIAGIGELLEPLAAIAPRRLKLVGIHKSTGFSGELVSVLQVERSDGLQKLHEKICDLVKPWFTYDVTGEMIAGTGSTSSPPPTTTFEGKQASPSTLRWIKEYPVKSSRSSFSPHITIGYGDLSDRVLPVDFAVSRLAMCHLGNHCTCTKILWSAEF